MNDPPVPVLQFTPYAYTQLIQLLDMGTTEVGAFGVTQLDNPLLVTELAVPLQDCSGALCEFDDNGVADLVEELTTKGLHPSQFTRVWIHTHPSIPPTPSGTDEETFSTVFGRNDWSVMFIMNKQRETYCRLQYNLKGAPKLATKIGVSVAWGVPEMADLKAIYTAKVRAKTVNFTGAGTDVVWEPGYWGVSSKLGGLFPVQHTEWLRNTNEHRPFSQYLQSLPNWNDLKAALTPAQSVELASLIGNSTSFLPSSAANTNVITKVGGSRHGVAADIGSADDDFETMLLLEGHPTTTTHDDSPPMKIGLQPDYDGKYREWMCFLKDTGESAYRVRDPKRAVIGYEFVRWGSGARNAARSVTFIAVNPVLQENIDLIAKAKAKELEDASYSYKSGSIITVGAAAGGFAAEPTTPATTTVAISAPA